MSDNNAFLGSWVMDVAASEYGGRPSPLKATYVIRPNPDAPGYTFDMAWITDDNRPMTATFDGVPNGERIPYGDPAKGGMIALVRVNDRQLDSYSYAGDAVIAQASRVLSADGNTMTVTQWGMGIGVGDPPLRSVSIYRRQ